jgi:hypothetical protein
MKSTDTDPQHSRLVGDFLDCVELGQRCVRWRPGRGGGAAIRKVLYVLILLTTNIADVQGIGRRYANIVLKKADIPLSKRAGELTEEDTEKIITIMQNPRQYKVCLFICTSFHL